MNRNWLAIIFVEHRLWIEGVDLRRSAVHEKMDDSFGTRGKVGRFRSERIDIGLFIGAGFGAGEGPERESAKAHSAGLEQFAARE